MTPLQLIIKREYIQDVTSRSFWIGTILLPILFLGFSFFLGIMMEDSDTLQKTASLGAEHNEDLGGIQIFSLLLSMFLILFLMVYGSMIFTKVKKEKASRIMEMLATTVTGRTMMLGKIIAVALTGLTQMAAWLALIVCGTMIILTTTGNLALLSVLYDTHLWWGILLALFYFIGGYMIFGSFYAMVGAMTDRDNENQGYIAIITFTLLISFYISSFAIDNPDTSLTLWCSFIPFTSPSIGTMAAISGAINIWQTLLSLVILYITAWFSVSIAGKIYTSAMLLNGTRFSPRDIITFIRAK